MKIEEYLQTLPKNIITGQDVQLSEKSLREIFNFVGLSKKDTFYHLGCGSGKGIALALKEFNVKNAVGIDNDLDKIVTAKDFLNEQKLNGKLICDDIRNCDISEASVILFWFTEQKVIDIMMNKFQNLKPDTRIITIWGPLPNCIPNKVQFPYIINRVPFTYAKNMQEQLLAVFGVKCVDFVTAWEFAERYTKTLGDNNIHNDRFLTIIQALTIWINAKNLGIACGNKIPESINTYIGIMKTYFDIDFEHLLEK